jgi:hypothetical protein
MTRACERFAATCSACAFWRREDASEFGVCFALPPQVQVGEDGGVECARPTTESGDPACSIFQPRN